MSIVENASEISKNNETIAKNMQKVYDAGVRSGLAQDPDYAEGFEDGHTQGLSDASGVIWEDLLSGEIPVGKAREADHAAEATHSINADRAALADKATEADHAATATNANYSANAGRAAEADHSDTATNATLAERAANADNADRADFAGHATTATQATSATTADTAKAFDGVLPVANGGTGAGTVDGALAVLGLTGAAKIATGSYEGTGEYFGQPYSAYKNTLTFPFVPKLVVVQGAGGLATELFMVNGTGSVEIPVLREGDMGWFNTYTDVTVSWSGNTVTWHTVASKSAGEQFNAKDSTYRYVAFG